MAEKSKLETVEGEIWGSGCFQGPIFFYSPTEPRTTEPRKTESRKSLPRMDWTSDGLNSEWTQPQMGLNPEWTEPRMGLNPEWTQPRMGLNPEWDSAPNGTQSRMGLNPEWDSTPNGLDPEWTRPRMDSTPTGTQPQMDSTPNGLNSEWDSTSNFYQPRIWCTMCTYIMVYNVYIYQKNGFKKREHWLVYFSPKKVIKASTYTSSAPCWRSWKL
jgi:hypothetical protein